MKYFFARLVASITSVQFYQQVLNEPFKQPLGFYLQFLLLITAILSIQFWAVTVPLLHQQLESVKAEALTSYPNDLTITWTGTMLESSYPVTVSFPTVTPVAIKEMADNLAVISNSEELSDQSVLFFITPTTLYLQDQGTTVSQESLATFLGSSNIQLTKETLPTQANMVVDWIKTNTQLLLYFYPVGMFLGLVISRTYLILIESCIIFLFLKISSIRISYRQLVQLVIALFVPAELVNLFANLAGLEITTSVLSLSFWIFFVYVFFSIKKA